MIGVNKDRLMAELWYTSLAINSTHSRYFFNVNYPGFSDLNDVLKDNYGISVETRELDNKHPMYNHYTKYLNTSLLSLVNYIGDSQDTIVKTFKNCDKFFKKIKYDDIKFYDVVRFYSEKDFKDIILSFFSTFNNDYYKLAKKYFDEGRVSVCCDCGSNGLFAFLQWLNSGYVLSGLGSYNTYTASTIAHEFGHAIDFEKFIIPQQKDMPLYSDILCEIPSITMELLFDDYLYNNKIDVDGSRITKNEIVSYLKKYSDCIKHMLPQTKLGIEEILVEEEYGDNIFDEECSLRDSLLYGLGTVFAYHLCEIKKSSSKDFMKIYNNIMTTRKECLLEDSIALTGYSLEDFISGKYVKPVIEKEYLELKKRFKL